MGFLLSKLLPLLVLPLGLGLLLQVAGLLGRQRRWGPWLTTGGVALLWLASMPWLSRVLVGSLERQGQLLTPGSLPSADAVVVLGGGVSAPVPPRRLVEVNDAGDRLLTGVQLMRQGKAPVLVVSGGRVSFTTGDTTPPEARSAAWLAGWLGVPPDRIVLSERARNTAEEARDVEALAKRRGWRSLLLVTSAAHLPRSVATFRRFTSLTIVPVACDFHLSDPGRSGRATPWSVLLDLLPSADALSSTSRALREVIGVMVYRIRGWI